tara:strand:+ start:21894 stop:22958 length:1065 start_codon:yes stop_codon:yes gene_type:complete
MSKPTVVLWPFKYKDLRTNDNAPSYSWETRIKWVCEALQEKGYDILQHKEFLADIPGAKEYENQKECDVVIYNHCDTSEIRGNVIKAERTWFFKPTVPDVFQTTLDELGYGSYSSITYDKPEFERVDMQSVNYFFESKVKNWINKNDSKWGKDHMPARHDIKIEDYYLVIGQCGGDSVVNHQDFGSYFTKLKLIIAELSRVADRPIIVKLHPYTNGKDYVPGVDKNYISELTAEIKSINENIIVYGDFSSIHDFIPNARCIFVGNSGAGFEVMMHHKPIISFCFPEYHWITYDLRKTCDIHNAIKIENWFDQELSDKFLYWYMEQYCFYDKTTAKDRVEELLGEPEIEYRTVFK